MPNFREIISKSILILLLGLHIVNALTPEEYLDKHGFTTSIRIQLRTKHIEVHGQLENELRDVEQKFYQAQVELRRSNDILEQRDAKIRHLTEISEGLKKQNVDLDMNLQTMNEYLQTTRKTNEEQGNMIKDVMAYNKKTLDKRDAKITRIKNKSEDLKKQKITLDTNLQTAETTLRQQEEEIKDLKAYNENMSQTLGKKDAEISNLKHDEVALKHFLKNQKKELEAKETDISCMRTELAQRGKEIETMSTVLGVKDAKIRNITEMSESLKKQKFALDKNFTATNENLQTMTTTLEKQEENIKDLKAYNENMIQTLGEKDGKISNLKHDKVALNHFLKNQTEQSKKELEAKETDISCMRTDLAQRGKEIETMNTVLGVKDAKIRNIAEMSESLKKQKFALDKNFTTTNEHLQTATTTLEKQEERIKDLKAYNENMSQTMEENVAEIRNLKQYKVTLKHFLKNLTVQRDMTLEAMNSENSRITSRLTEKEATIETMNQTLKERMADVKTLAVVVVLMLFLFYVFVMPCLRRRFRKDVPNEVRSGQSLAVLP